MRIEFRAEGKPIDPSWWAPLEALARAVAGNTRYRFFEIDDFMLMGKVVRTTRPDLYLYKHRHTRRELSIDEAGLVYRFIPPRSLDSRGDGRYLAHRDQGRALDHLDLWELPWMKEGLERHQQGLDWEHRWRLHPDVEEWERRNVDREPAGTCGWSDI